MNISHLNKLNIALLHRDWVVGRIKVPAYADVYKEVKVSGCPYTYNLTSATPPDSSRTEVIKETKVKSGTSLVTVKEVLIYNRQQQIQLERDTTVLIPYQGFANGKADFYLEEKDKTNLYVSYWLDRQHMVDSGTKVRLYKPVYDCSGKLDAQKSVVVDKGSLTLDTWYNGSFIKADKFNSTLDWIRNSERIEVMNSDGTLKYCIVNRYSQDYKYIWKLAVRKYIPYSYPSFSLSAITIPIKVRPGFTRREKEIASEAIAAVNVGAYGSFHLTKKAMQNKAGTFKAMDRFSVQAGPFLSASVVSLDNKNTSGAIEPLDSVTTRTMAAISAGAGATLNWKGFQLGIFGGWDMGIGDHARTWNHNGRLWWGFGLGYKLTDLFVQKQD